MENWQRDVITNNLVELIQETECNLLLLAKLSSGKIINNEEKQRLIALTTNIDKANKLYELLLTRVNAYQVLLKACKEENQSGVVAILENGEIEHNLSEALQECNVTEFICQCFISTFDFERIVEAIAKYSEITQFEKAFEKDQEKKPWLLRGPKHETLLHVATAYGYIKLMKYFISKVGIDVNDVDIDGRTAGHYLGKYSTNIIETTKCLISKGLNILHVDNSGMTVANTLAIHNKVNQFHYQKWAEHIIQEGHKEVFAPNSKTSSTALHHVLTTMDMRRSTLELLNFDNNVNLTDVDGRTILHVALICGRNLETIQNLIKLGADYKIKDKANGGVLHFAVEGGRFEVVKLIISYEPKINTVDNLNETPLHKVRFTKSRDYLGMTKFLLDFKADLHAKDKSGNTLAHLFALAENISSSDFQAWVNGLRGDERGKLFASRGEFGRTPLQTAMQRLDLEFDTIKLILDSSKVDINQLDDKGYTVLHLAMDFGRSAQTIKDLKLLGATIKIKDNNDSLHKVVAGGDGLHVSEININMPDNEGRTSLHRALADGKSLADIKYLIDNKADYKMKDNSNEAGLHFAVQGGNKEVISFLLSLKLEINEVDAFGKTPLHKVTFTKYQDYLGITTFLLDNGANLLAKDKYENTVAHLFANTEDISCSDFQIWVKGMIKSGQGHIFATRGQVGRTPLQDAMQRLDLDLATLKLILESSKVDINQTDDNGSTLLLLSLSFGRSLETIKNLISLGANIKTKNKKGNGALHMAVIGGNQEVIQYLISRGLDVNAKNIYGDTPLHCVRETIPKRYFELTKLLLETGADLCSKKKDGKTLAHKMAISTNVSCEDLKIWVTAMIENGHAHLFTIGGRWGRTPLHSSMWRRDLDLETIKLIIESAKLDINQPDDEGNSILHLALRFGRSLDTIKSLVELGADWKRKGMDDCSVLHFAVEGSNKEAFLYFKSLGADVNAKHKYGKTPLHYVRWTESKDYLGMTKFLLENGANLNAKDNSGKTLDHWMKSCDKVSTEEYAVWKEGMINMGHAAFFKHESS